LSTGENALAVSTFGNGTNCGVAMVDLSGVYQPEEVQQKVHTRRGAARESVTAG